MPVITTRIASVIRDPDGNEKHLSPSESLRIRGPVIDGVLTVSDAQQQALGEMGRTGKHKTGHIMFDTGASLTCFDTESAAEVGLAIVGRGNMASASHENHPTPMYSAKIIIANLNFNLEKGMGANLKSQNLIALIGRDILQRGSLFYNGMDGSISFAI